MTYCLDLEGQYRLRSKWIFNAHSLANMIIQIN